MTSATLLRNPSARFHLLMGSASLIAALIGAISLATHTIQVQDVSGPILGALVLAAMVSPLPAYWHQKGQYAKRDAVLVIPYCLVMSQLLRLVFLTAGRNSLPLQDDLFRSMDHALGFHSPALMAWAQHAGIAAPLEHVYFLLQPLMMVAVLAPALLGMRQAREYLLANLVALSIVGVVFLLLPAVGPWFPHQFTPSPLQVECQRDLLQLRQTGIAQGVGIVCFPSCHVLWAVLSVAALWGFRWLRIPATVLCAGIVLSTMTTGWHYLVDVLAALLLAFGSIVAARRLARWTAPLQDG